MDGVLFEGQITFSKANLKESIRAWFFNSKLWLLLFVPIPLIICGIFALIHNGDGAFLAIGIIFAAVMPLTLIIRYNLNTKLTYNRFREQNSGQEITHIVRFFDSNITLTNPLTNNTLNYNYSTVKKIIESKNLIMLLTEAKAYIALEKTKFTIGNQNDLILFIRSKGIK